MSYHYVQKQLRPEQITQNLATLAFQNQPLNEQTQAILAALRFLKPELQHADLAQIRHYLHSLDEQHIIAFIPKLKTALHQLECLCITEAHEQFYTSYQNTQQRAAELLFSDVEGDSWLIALETTPNSHLNSDLKCNPEDALLAAEHMLQLEQPSLPSKALTQSVEDAVDLLVTAKDPNDEHFWDYFPGISLLTVSIAIFELFQRYQKHQISWDEFKWMAAKISGIKVSKIAVIGVLLGLPIVGQITGAYLVAKLLLNAKATWFEKDAALYRYLQQKRQKK